MGAFCGPQYQNNHMSLPVRRAAPIFLLSLEMGFKAEFHPKNVTSALSAGDPQTCHIWYVIFFWGGGERVPCFYRHPAPASSPSASAPEDRSPLPPLSNLLGHVTGPRRLPGHSQRRSHMRSARLAVKPQLGAHS